jgi:hypothetical protein
MGLTRPAAGAAADTSAAPPGHQGHALPDNFCMQHMQATAAAYSGSTVTPASVALLAQAQSLLQSQAVCFIHGTPSPQNCKTLGTPSLTHLHTCAHYAVQQSVDTPDSTSAPQTCTAVAGRQEPALLRVTRIPQPCPLLSLSSDLQSTRNIKLVCQPSKG